MKTTLACLCVALLVLAGCQSGGTPPATQPVEIGDRVIASVPGASVTYGQVYRPLLDLYGLETILYVMQLQMAKEEARAMQLVVTPADVKAEVIPSARLVFPMLNDSSKVSEEQALSELQRYLSCGPAALDLWIEANAYFRKILDPQIRKAMSDTVLKDAFGVLYGEKVVIRHIQVANLLEAMTVKQKITEGLPFDEAARKFSRDPLTAQNGGLIDPPFTYAQCRWSEQFRDTCFSLKEGQLADEFVESGKALHLIKLEKKIPPDARFAKFEDPETQEYVRKWAVDRLMAKVMAAKREQYRDLIRQHLKISDSALASQYQALLDHYKAREKEKTSLLKQYDLQAAAAATQAATGPSTTTAPVKGATRPATLPASREGTAAPTTAGRPPATMPGK